MSESDRVNNSADTTARKRIIRFVVILICAVILAAFAGLAVASLRLGSGIPI